MTWMNEIDHRALMRDVDFRDSVEVGDGGTDRSSTARELDERISPVSEPQHKFSASCAELITLSQVLPE
jgi:hypothetical protein